MGDHREFEDCTPFAETVAMLKPVLADGIMDAEELADLFWSPQTCAKGPKKERQVLGVKETPPDAS